MKKHEIAKPFANGHISMVNIVRGASDSCLIVRWIVLTMESTDESTSQDSQKRSK